MQYTCTTDWDTRISCQYQLIALDISYIIYLELFYIKIFTVDYLFLLTAGGMLVVCVLTILFCHAIISFTFGMSNLVFWILTCCQCPFPCQQYKGV